MIHCPKCGATNRRSSRVCHECEAPLSTTSGVRCPMCGTMNAVGNAHCDRCNARLTPMTEPVSEAAEPEQTPVEELALPSVPPAGVDQTDDIDSGAGSGDETEGDWLARLRASTMEAAEDAEEIERQGASGDSDDIPDWLRDLEPVDLEARIALDLQAVVAKDASATEQPPNEGVPAAVPEPIGVPDLLPGTMPPVVATAEDVPRVPERGAQTVLELAEVPDWLQEMMPPEVGAADDAPPAPEAEPRATASALLEPAGFPDGLQEAMPSEVSEAARLAVREPAEAPDQLQGIVPPEEAAGEGAPAMVGTLPEAAARTMPELAEIPGWLQEIVPPEDAAGEGAPPGPEAVPEMAVPAMREPVEGPESLQETMPPEEVVGERAPSAAVEASEIAVPAIPELAEIPDWLRDVAPPQAAEPSTAVSAQLPRISEPPRGDEAASETPLSPLPDFPAGAETDGDREWLAALEAGLGAPSAPPGVDREGVVPPLFPGSEPGLPQTEQLARARIPDWLEALRPTAETREMPGEEESLETEGVLEGLRGVLPLAPVVEEPAIPGQVQPAGSSQASLARAQLLQSLLTQPRAVTQPEIHGPRARTGEQIQRSVVAIVLVSAILGTLLAPFFAREVPTLVRLPDGIPSADRLYNAVESVSPGKAVVFAFEYGPPQADELDLVAGPIMRHVLEQGGRISAVSTRPDGLAVAARMIGAVSPDVEVDQYDLTYVPGKAAGVSQFLRWQPDLIIVLTGEPAPLRWWVEQTHATSSPPPVVAGTSAALEPAASPYLDPNTGQLAGAVSGLSGAAYYEKKTLGESGGWATERLNALAVGHIAITGLMVLGAIFYAIGGSRGRSK